MKWPNWQAWKMTVGATRLLTTMLCTTFSRTNVSNVSLFSNCFAYHCSLLDLAAGIFVFLYSISIVLLYRQDQKTDGRTERQPWLSDGLAIFWNGLKWRRRFVLLRRFLGSENCNRFFCSCRAQLWTYILTYTYLILLEFHCCFQTYVCRAREKCILKHNHG